VAIHGVGGAAGGLRIGKIGRQFGVQARLVVLDREQVVAALVQDRLSQGGLGLQGVGGDDPAAQGQRGQEVLGHGDLVGLVVHAHLDQRLVRGVGGD